MVLGVSVVAWQSATNTTLECHRIVVEHGKLILQASFNGLQYLSFELSYIVFEARDLASRFQRIRFQTVFRQAKAASLRIREASFLLASYRQ